MYRKRRLANWGAKRLRENEDFKRGQNACNHYAGHDAARHAIDCEERAAIHDRKNMGIECAHHSGNQGEPENEPDPAR